VSYAVLPLRLLPAYETIFGTFFSAVSTLEQKTLELFMRSDAWESHLRRMRAANKKRHDKLMGCLHELLGDAVTLWGGDAGLHVVLESQTGLSEQDMVSRALERSVQVYPLSPLCARQDNRAKGMVMVGFGCLSEHEIVEGVKRLAEAWLPG
jgi:GntR family transcriptional regulator/MocR family aminotransferase